LVIDHLNQIGRVVIRVKKLRPQGPAISIISVAELYHGIHDSRHAEQGQQALEAFSKMSPCWASDEEICQHCGSERGRPRQQGALIGNFDLLIAPTGLYLGLMVLTNNRQHFERVEGLQIHIGLAEPVGSLGQIIRLGFYCYGAPS
jgi:tRNA(fMet)-specific endonuclease VapC